VFGLALDCSGEQLTCTIQELPLPLAQLDRVDGMVSVDLLDRRPATDRLHGGSGLEFGTAGTALAH